MCLSDIQLDDLFQIDIDRGTDNTDVMLAESVSLEKYRPNVVSYRHSDASEREETRVPLETLSILSGMFTFPLPFRLTGDLTDFYRQRRAVCVQACVLEIGGDDESCISYALPMGAEGTEVAGEQRGS